MRLSLSMIVTRTFVSRNTNSTIIQILPSSVARYNIFTKNNSDVKCTQHRKSTTSFWKYRCGSPPYDTGGCIALKRSQHKKKKKIYSMAAQSNQKKYSVPLSIQPTQSSFWISGNNLQISSDSTSLDGNLTPPCSTLPNKELSSLILLLIVYGLDNCYWHY